MTDFQTGGGTDDNGNVAYELEEQQNALEEAKRKFRNRTAEGLCTQIACCLCRCICGEKCMNWLVAIPWSLIILFFGFNACLAEARSKFDDMISDLQGADIDFSGADSIVNSLIAVFSIVNTTVLICGCIQGIMGKTFISYILPTFICRCSCCNDEGACLSPSNWLHWIYFILFLFAYVILAGAILLMLLGVLLTISFVVLHAGCSATGNTGLEDLWNDLAREQAFDFMGEYDDSFADEYCDAFDSATSNCLTFTIMAFIMSVLQPGFAVAMKDIYNLVKLQATEIYMEQQMKEIMESERTLHDAIELASETKE